MRTLIFFASLLLASAAAAQPAPAPAASQSEAARVSELLAANWRPLTATPAPGAVEAALQAACEGAEAELAQLDASLPREMTSDAVGMVRAPRGFVIVPANDDPTQAFLFPNAELATIASGLARVEIVNAAQGRVNLRDAAGGVTQLQLGLSGRQAVMRVLRTGRQPLTYVGCISSVN